MLRFISLSGNVQERELLVRTCSHHLYVLSRYLSFHRFFFATPPFIVAIPRPMGKGNGWRLKETLSTSRIDAGEHNSFATWGMQYAREYQMGCGRGWRGFFYADRVHRRQKVSRSTWVNHRNKNSWEFLSEYFCSGILFLFFLLFDGTIFMGQKYSIDESRRFTVTYFCNFISVLYFSFLSRYRYTTQNCWISFSFFFFRWSSIVYLQTA